MSNIIETLQKSEMPFLEHLEELRWRIIKAVISVVIASIGAAFFAEYLVKEILLGPLLAVGLKAQVLTPYGIMLLYMEVVLVAGIIISMPVVLYQLWQFIAPALLPGERKYSWWIIFFTSLCFLAGIAFGYFVILPTSLAFFSSFGTTIIELNIAIDSYVSFVLTLILGAGLIFELPMVTYFLSKIGILHPLLMRKYRRHAIVIILIISALVTPTPDILTQSLFAAPMIILYEISIFISHYAQKKQSNEISPTHT